MISRILVPVDGSSTAQRGLSEAIDLVKQTHGTLRILHAVNQLLLTDVPVTPVTPEQYQHWMDGMREQGRRTLQQAQAFARDRNVEAEVVLIDMVGKRPADIIIEQAKSWPADLIVMGTHGRRGMSRILMGSDAEMTLRSSAVPVMLVREAADSTWIPSPAASS